LYHLEREIILIVDHHNIVLYGGIDGAFHRYGVDAVIARIIINKVAYVLVTVVSSIKVNNIHINLLEWTGYRFRSPPGEVFSGFQKITDFILVLNLALNDDIT